MMGSNTFKCVHYTSDDNVHIVDYHIRAFQTNMFMTFYLAGLTENPLQTRDQLFLLYLINDKPLINIYMQATAYRII